MTSPRVICVVSRRLPLQSDDPSSWKVQVTLDGQSHNAVVQELDNGYQVGRFVLKLTVP